MKTILVIDDDMDTCLLLERFLAKKGFAVTSAANARSGLALIEKNDFSLVISDFRLPDMTGLELLKEAKKSKPKVKFIIITGYSDIRMAVEVIKYGAVDYVTKPLYPEELLSLVNETLQKEDGDNGYTATHADNAAKSRTPKPMSKDYKDADYLVGKSEASKRVAENVALIAPTPMSVVITGETGTGKEYVAKRIHQLSSRAQGPFIAIDCGALPKDIAGSEFFGHEQGAFTGAVKSKDGKFKQADGGTIFLDEIGNLSYEIQLKLLRILQERTYTRIGGSKEISVDVRVLAATNENLKEAVADGRFREDLYYRLNEFSIDLSPLRQRIADLNEFTESFIEQANILLGKNVQGLADEVWAKFEQYSWPGNLRELRNVIKRCVLLTKGEVIGLITLPDEIAYYRESSIDAGSGNNSLREAAEEAERERIVKALSQAGNNKSKAARLLNIDRKTLYNKLKSYDI